MKFKDRNSLIFNSVNLSNLSQVAKFKFPVYFYPGGYRYIDIYHTIATCTIYKRTRILNSSGMATGYPKKNMYCSFQVLLPKGCCKVIYSSDTYEESWRCNFLGLSKFCMLPKHVVEVESYALISVDSPTPCDGVSALSVNDLEPYRVTLHTGQPWMDRSTGKTNQSMYYK